MLINRDKKSFPKIVILGPPGSGKGTHSKILSRYFKIPIVSAGELLRKKAKKDVKIRKIINAGKLVPDAVIDNLIKREVQKRKGVIIEGYPRDLKALNLLKKYFIPDVVVFLNISKKESLRRLSNRWLCENCNVTYSIYNQPKKEGFCDNCGRKLIRRSDDTPKAIRTRLSMFKKATLPVLRWYKKQGGIVKQGSNTPQGLVLEINGNGRSIKEVSRELINKLKIWKKLR